MKKLLLVCLLTTLSVFSYALGVKVASGSTACLKEKANFVLEIDVTNAKWLDKEDFKTWCGPDFEERMSLMQNAFVASFNKNSKAAKMVDNTSDAKYKIVMKFSDFTRVLSGFPGQMRVIGDASIYIVEIATGKTVCTIDADKVNGGDDYVDNDRFVSLVENIAKKIAKLK